MGQYYFKDNSAVYYYNRASFGHGSLLTLPFDPSTFRILDVVQIKPNDLTLHGYVSDKNGVYYGNVLVKGADQVSFSLVGYTEYTGDKGGRTTPIYYGKDKSSVYYQGKLLEGADSDSFEIIPNGPYYQEFAKDRASVFYNEKKVTGADPKTYKPLSGQPYEGCSEGPYGVDKTSVYYQNIKIEGADVKTFEVMVGDDSYGKDVHYFYHRSERADPKTFKACSYG